MARGDDYGYIEIPGVEPDIVTRWNSLLQRKGVEAGKMFEVMVRSFDRGPIKYSLLDVLNFGKYSGMLVEDVIRTDTRYIRWLVNTSEWFRLTGGALDLLIELEG